MHISKTPPPPAWGSEVEWEVRWGRWKAAWVYAANVILRVSRDWNTLVSSDGG